MNAPDTTAAPLYRASAMGSALLRMWRAWRILIPTIIINALLQALFILPNVTPGLNPAFIVLAVASFLGLVASFLLVTTALLVSTSGHVGIGPILASSAPRFLPLLAWSVGLLLAVLMGLILYVIPGLIILAATPYLLIAVVDGQRSPLAVNFRTIRARWGRWLITVALMGLVCFVVWFLSALNGFFITGAPGAFLGWLLAGLIASWLICTWVLIYRAVEDDGAPTTSDSGHSRR